MAADAQDEERADRDHSRSAEARWKVAEAGADDPEGPADAARDSDEQEDAPKDEGAG